jgi:ribosome biogenesis GTPase
MLRSFGWTARLEAAFEPHRGTGLDPARIAREDRARYRVLTRHGERGAEVAGRFRHAARARADFPAVGDWVAVRTGDDDGPCVIEALLPRSSAFTRKAAGDVTEEQVIAANVDSVFLVSGLDAELNPRRIERYLAAAWESGATPVVVLNKADVVDDPGSCVAEIERVAPGVPVVAVSARSGARLESLRPWLLPGSTVALLGSSGVGKSTLVNALLGEARQDTGAIREDDSRGRHTTTHRELIPLPGGAVLLDTPGMRELQLWADDSTLAGAFPDIEALAGACRFRDCRHDSEPGCAVRAADADGELAPGRLESWRKLQRELRWLARKQDVRLRLEEENRWRSISRSHRRQKRSREP